jgi:hypothetical protein
VKKRGIIIITTTTTTTTTNNQIQGNQPVCQLNQCDNNVDVLYCWARACAVVIKMKKENDI